MRPRLNELEISFLLDLLKETEAKMKRQHHNLKEECEQVRQNTIWLEHLAQRNPYPTYKILKNAKDRWTALQFEWIPFYHKQTVLLRCLIIRFEKILARKKGRIPRLSYYYDTFLQKAKEREFSIISDHSSKVSAYDVLKAYRDS